MLCLIEKSVLIMLPCLMLWPGISSTAYCTMGNLQVTIKSKKSGLPDCGLATGKTRHFCKVHHRIRAIYGDTLKRHKVGDIISYQARNTPSALNAPLWKFPAASYQAKGFAFLLCYESDHPNSNGLFSLSYRHRQGSRSFCLRHP